MKTEERGDSDTLRRSIMDTVHFIITKGRLLEFSALANTEKGGTPAMTRTIIPQKSVSLKFRR